ncbi:phosphate ABC transporter substrate-binding protein PstS [Burkholderia multivorans]|uniref:phosphate ABC transporter substrate-binding protein PstS n=1 Tax=Burkholderia TaxID=32008 RepID=UPI000A1A2BF0|nr:MULTISPECIES: phosphate ABC transporter substrate-binding protein PstS [Burkholderia]ARL04495.1 phosphate ABC transporter substrate-binding protein PstS [Burkholderia pseudomallei]MBU9468733.1 phosphate ABC transporter substrate-binding protein PstS [Burkholderia multivorans]MCA8129638.1 phosphate ABC transporter substrate-binding protein PstS [Burkholderia multivorans]
MNKRFVQRLAGVVVTATFAVAAHAAEITGAGSTFVYPILSKWSSDYNQASGTKVNYQSIGSGGGIAQIKAATVDFGATDMPMSVADLKAKEMGQFPSVVGGVVPVVNIDGVAPGKMHFTGPVLADIYLGKIKKWSDPAITKINPGLKLPDANITVVHRSDGSGTTFNWVNYLSKVSPDWKSKVGEGTSVAWPTGVGGKGNEGVAAYVNRLKNSIGYVEYAYVLQNKMTYGSVQNKAGKFVEPNAKSFQAAAATADWTKAQDFDLVMTDAAGPDAYPVTATTFIVMYKQPKNPAQSKATIDFFRWALEKGQQQAESLDYVPLPPALVKQIETYWSTNFKF